MIFLFSRISFLHKYNSRCRFYWIHLKCKNRTKAGTYVYTGTGNQQERNAETIKFRLYPVPRNVPENMNVLSSETKIKWFISEMFLFYFLPLVTTSSFKILK